jgi:hypothetical protein
MNLKKAIADNSKPYMYNNMQSDIDSIVRGEDILLYVSIYKTTQLKDENEFLTTGYISNDICDTLTKYYFSCLNCSPIKVCNKC